MYVIKIDGKPYTQEELDLLPDPIHCRFIEATEHNGVVKQSIVFEGLDIFPDKSGDLSWWGDECV